MKKITTLLAMVLSLHSYCVTLNLHGQLTGNSFLGGIPITISGVAGVGYYNIIYTDASGNYSLSNIILSDLQGGLSVNFTRADGTYSTSNRYFTSTTTDLDYNTQVYCNAPFSSTSISYSGTIAGAPAGTAVSISGYLGSNYSNTLYTDASGYFADSNIVSTLPVGNLSLSYINPDCNGQVYNGYAYIYFNTSSIYNGNLGMLMYCDSSIIAPFTDSLVPVRLNAKITNAPIGAQVQVSYYNYNSSHYENWTVTDNAGTIKDSINSDVIMLSIYTGAPVMISYQDCSFTNTTTTSIIRHVGDTILNYQNNFCPANPTVTIDGWVKAVNPNNPSQLITPQSRVYLIRNYTNLASGDSIVADSTTTDANGYYKFAGVFIWDYSVKAAVLSTDPNYSQFFPTYELPNQTWTGTTYTHSSLSWQNSIFQGYQNYTVPVQLIAGNNIGGPGLISGIVQQGAGRSNSNIKVGHISIYILDSAGQPVQYTYTDATGHFSFSNLAYGFYTISVDYYNKPCQYTTFYLDESNKTNQFVFFTIEPTEITSNMSFTSINEVSSNAINLYPNPVKNLCNLTFDNSNIKQITIQTILGETVINVSSQSQSTQLDMSNLAKGVYIITVIENNKKQTRKLFKE